jgi:ATP-dependent DNA helicase DinG
MWIDTLALSRIALPCLRTHKLSELAAAFGCASVTHQAMDDVDALVGLWRIILLGLSDLPDGLLSLLATMHSEVQWPYRVIFRHLSLKQKATTFNLKLYRNSLINNSKEMAFGEDIKAPQKVKIVDPEEIKTAFSSDGLVSKLYESYENRPEQILMSTEVANAVSTSTHRAIEAGTGVGKTMAYLLPEVIFAKRNKLTVGIATKTNALSDQLMSKELPSLAKALQGGFSYTSLKGYEHYPCLLRLDYAAASTGLPSDIIVRKDRSSHTAACEALTAIAVVYAFACQSLEGDLDALGIRWKYVPRQMLTTTFSECSRTQCPYFPNECFLFSARRRAASVDVLITNHALLLRDVQADGKILPPIKNWVIDEAHGFEDEARKQWAREVSTDALKTGFELLGNTKSGVLHSLFLELGKLEDSTFVLRLLTKETASVTRASMACLELFSNIESLGAELNENRNYYDHITIWINKQVRKKQAWLDFVKKGKEAWLALDNACKGANDIVKTIEQDLPRASLHLSEATHFMVEVRDTLRLILAGDDSSYVYYFDLPNHRNNRGVKSLYAEKIDIGSDLSAHWLSSMNSVVFTSATLSIGKSFEHFDHSVGLDLVGAAAHKGISLRSSFDFDKNMAVVLASDMSEPGDKHYLPDLEELLYDIHVSMGGSVLTLFTNRRDMEHTFSSLAPRLETKGLELCCQTRGSSPRQLRENFIANESQSLFALRSFWEGFDATGNTLRCVVIPKLPFANPNDPLVKEREAREDRSWWRHSLPEAILTVKQAAGRLIRSNSDTGILILADSRLLTKRYGKQFISALPSHNVHQIERKNITSFITIWRCSKD